MPIIEWSDLQEIVPSGTSEGKATKWIEKAETRLRTLLRLRGVSLDELADDPDHAAEVKNILENAVLGVLRNPEGIRTESEGDYSVGYGLDSSGNVRFPDSDLDLLAPPAVTVGTIRLGLPAHRLPPESW